MVLGIREKLMIAFAGLSVLITLLAFVVMLLSFRAGFLQYVNDLRVRSLEQFHETLTSEVASLDQWNALIHDPRQWHDLIRSHHRKVKTPLKPKRDADRSPSATLTPKFAEEHKREWKPKRKWPKPIFMLFDKDQQVIYGKLIPWNNMHNMPIKVKEQIVGYVGLPELQHLNDNADKAFVAKQTRYFIFSLLLSAVLAVIVAFFLSKWMVNPLKKVILAMNRLEGRDYEANVDYRGRDEIGHLVQAFNRLTSSLAEHESSQRQWIADISHELRTPLATLKGELEALQDGVRVLCIDRIDSLYEEIIRLQRLVDDLHQLSISDIGAMCYQFEAVDIREVLEDILDSASLEDKQLSFSIQSKEEHYYAYGDSDRLLQLFRNLLQNSLRYTDAPGRIQVSLQQTKDNCVKVCWEDSSPSVDSKALPKLFDRLYREELSRNREQGGSGLGLSICYAIIKAHRGQINARHSALGGLAIDIVLPSATFKKEVHKKEA